MAEQNQEGNNRLDNSKDLGRLTKDGLLIMVMQMRAIAMTKGYFLPRPSEDYIGKIMDTR